MVPYRFKLVKTMVLWLFFGTFKVKMKISPDIQWQSEPFQGKQRFAYNTGMEISEGLHSRLSTGGTELRLKEPED